MCSVLFGYVLDRIINLHSNKEEHAMCLFSTAVQRVTDSDYIQGHDHSTDLRVNISDLLLAPDICHPQLLWHILAETLISPKTKATRRRFSSSHHCQRYPSPVRTCLSTWHRSCTNSSSHNRGSILGGRTCRCRRRCRPRGGGNIWCTKRSTGRCRYSGYSPWWLLRKESRWRLRGGEAGLPNK